MDMTLQLTQFLWALILPVGITIYMKHIPRISKLWCIKPAAESNIFQRDRKMETKRFKRWFIRSNYII